MSECKDGHDFIEINDLPKIDNIKCSKCGVPYYQFLLREIGLWKQENAKLKQELIAERESLRFSHEYTGRLLNQIKSQNDMIRDLQKRIAEADS